jgi:hypothetical protein
MALVRLTREEATEGILPRVCLRCGADASVTRDKVFAWHPQWVDILLLLSLIAFAFFWVAIILSMALNVRMRVRVPLCDAHKNYFRNRALYLYVGLLFFAMLGIASAAIVFTNQFDDSVGPGLICGLPIGLGFVWLISAAIVHSGMVKAAEINERGITLTRVSPEFIAALRADRRADYDDEQRPRREYRDDDKYRDPKEPYPKRPPLDAYREDER